MLLHEDLHCGKHLPAILDLARKATPLRQDIVKKLCMLASLLLKVGEDEQAITVLTEAISKLPPDPRLYEMLARANHQAPRGDFLSEELQRAPVIPIDD